MWRKEGKTGKNFLLFLLISNLTTTTTTTTTTTNNNNNDDDDNNINNNNNNRIQRRNSRFFLQSPHCTANCLQHIRSSGPGAIVCKSRATHRALITCNMSCYVPRGTKGQLSYQVWQSLNRIYLSFILLAEPLTDKGREETGVPGENPWRRASEHSHSTIPSKRCT